MDPNPPAPSRRLLVVDDDRTVARSVARQLRSGPLDFEVDAAPSGEEALDRVRAACDEERPYAVAWVDIHLGRGWDGFETSRQLWRVDPELEVVLCTGHPDIHWRTISERLGDRTDRLVLLCKPFEPIEVQQLAVGLAEKRQLRSLARGRLLDLERRVAERTAELNSVVARLRREMADRERLEMERHHVRKLEAVGQLASGIAHEINTPIQFVGDSVHFLRTAFEDLRTLALGYRRTLEEAGALDDPDRAEDIRSLEAGADLAFLDAESGPAFDRTFDGIQRVTDIVRAMREFAHPSRNAKTAADLNRLIHNTLTVARSEYKHVADVELELGEVPAVVCHPGDIGQVFLNVLVNAAHAIRDAQEDEGRRGRILIRSRQDGGDVVVTIADDGPGIPAHVSDHVFEPFFTTKPVGQGTGQGLAISHAIVVDRHGGQLSLETEPGEGTRFHVRLPIEASGSEGRPATEVPS